MLKKFVIIPAALLIFGSAFSEDKIIEPTLKADLRQVEESGVVTPVDGITAAGQPSKAAFEVFAANGYTTVIDLRGEQENRGLDEARVVEELGMEYVLLPITSPDTISFENAARLDEIIKNADGPVLVHCGSSNRVGALLALRKKLGGADAEAAMSHGFEGGMESLAGHVQDILTNDL